MEYDIRHSPNGEATPILIEVALDKLGRLGI